MKGYGYACVLIASIAANAPAQANHVNIPVAKDNTLYENATGAISNGAGEYFFSGNTGASLHRRGVVAFAIDSYVPPGSTITKVTLSLNFSRTLDFTPRTVNVHRLLADWGEGLSDAIDEEGQGIASNAGDATWIHRFYNQQLWSAAGGDFIAAPSGSQTVPIFGEYGRVNWTSTGMAADVQSWLDNPATNFGWILVNNEEEPATSRRFDSTNHSDYTVRPNLRVEFDPPPGTPTLSSFSLGVCFLMLSAISVLTTRRMRSESRAAINSVE